MQLLHRWEWLVKGLKTTCPLLPASLHLTLGRLLASTHSHTQTNTGAWWRLSCRQQTQPAACCASTWGARASGRAQVGLERGEGAVVKQGQGAALQLTFKLQAELSLNSWMHSAPCRSRLPCVQTHPHCFPCCLYLLPHALQV